MIIVNSFLPTRAHSLNFEGGVFLLGTLLNLSVSIYSCIELSNAGIRNV